MKIRSKISCINSLEEALLVVAEKPDIIEIIVETKPGVDIRSKSKSEAVEILNKLKGKVETSILTDNTDTSELLKLIDGLPFDYLFPIATPNTIVLEKIKQSFPNIKIVPTIHVIDQSSLAEVDPLNLNPFVDLIHLDSRVKNKLGGTGKTHDWSVSKEIVRRSRKPVILAGGLKPENVHEAIKIVKPWGVDTYSGVLNERRELDINRVKQFIQNAKY